jgi:hypothetical protein
MSGRGCWSVRLLIKYETIVGWSGKYIVAADCIYFGEEK